MDARKVAKQIGRKAKKDGSKKDAAKENEDDGKKKKPAWKEPRWGNYQNAWKIAVYWIKTGVIPLESQGEEDDMDIYYWHDEFCKFLPEKWPDRLQKCREVVQRKLKRVDRDQALYDKFRARNPVDENPQVVNGYGVWYGSKADEVFREDIENEIEKQFKSWQDYKDSKPEVYKHFTADQLRWRKGYLIRRRKFDNHTERHRRKKLKKMGMEHEYVDRRTQK